MSCNLVVRKSSEAFWTCCCYFSDFSSLFDFQKNPIEQAATSPSLLNRVFSNFTGYFSDKLWMTSIEKTAQIGHQLVIGTHLKKGSDIESEKLFLNNKFSDDSKVLFTFSNNVKSFIEKIVYNDLLNKDDTLDLLSENLRNLPIYPYLETRLGQDNVRNWLKEQIALLQGNLNARGKNPYSLVLEIVDNQIQFNLLRFTGNFMVKCYDLEDSHKLHRTEFIENVMNQIQLHFKTLLKAQQNSNEMFYKIENGDFSPNLLQNYINAGGALNKAFLDDQGKICLSDETNTQKDLELKRFYSPFVKKIFSLIGIKQDNQHLKFDNEIYLNESLYDTLLDNASVALQNGLDSSLFTYERVLNIFNTILEQLYLYKDSIGNTEEPKNESLESREPVGVAGKIDQEKCIDFLNVVGNLIPARLTNIIFKMNIFSDKSGKVLKDFIDNQVAVRDLTGMIFDILKTIPRLDVTAPSIPLDQIEAKILKETPKVLVKILYDSMDDKVFRSIEKLKEFCSVNDNSHYILTSFFTILKILSLAILKLIQLLIYFPLLKYEETVTPKLIEAVGSKIHKNLVFNLMDCFVDQIITAENA